MSNEEKDDIAATLRSSQETEHYADDNVIITESTTLTDLVDERSRFLFDELRVCAQTWLYLPAADWAQNEDFIKFRDFVKGLKVTNDVAEQGFKLIEDFTDSIIKDEGQLQDVLLLQLAEQHRERFPDSKKSSLQKM